MRGLLVPHLGAWDEIEGVVGQMSLSHLFLGPHTSEIPVRLQGLRLRGELRILAYEGCADFGHIVKTQRSSDTFVNLLAGLVVDFDGLFLDWRAPGFDSKTGVETNATISEAVRYASLLRDIRKAVGKHRDLIISLPVLPTHVMRVLPILEEIKGYVNSFVVRGFDCAWKSARATHASPLYPVVDAALQCYSKVIRVEKMALAVPCWTTVFANCAGIDRPFEEVRFEAEGCVSESTLVRDVGAGMMPFVEDEKEVRVFEDGV